MPYRTSTRDARACRRSLLRTARAGRGTRGRRFINFFAPYRDLIHASCALTLCEFDDCTYTNTEQAQSPLALLLSRLLELVLPSDDRWTATAHMRTRHTRVRDLRQYTREGTAHSHADSSARAGERGLERVRRVDQRPRRRAVAVVRHRQVRVATREVLGD